MNPGKQPVFLRIFKNGKLLEVKQFTGEQIVMGREGNVDALIRDPSISPIHAMIEERKGEYFICDLGSSNGVFVNGIKVIDHKLETGAEFQIGQIIVEFHIGVPKPRQGGGVQTPTFSKVIPQDIPKRPIVQPIAQAAGMERVAQKLVRPPGRATFAPSSKAKLNEILKPGKGNVVEVLVFWGDRVLSTRHFNIPQGITIGFNGDNNIILPSFGSIRSNHPLIRIESAGTAVVYLLSDMTGDVIKENASVSFDDLKKKGIMTPVANGFLYALQQNEYIKINFGNGVGVIIRFVGAAPDSKLLPFIDLSLNQLTGIVLGLMGTAVFMFYAYLYAPNLPEKMTEEQEPPRKAQFFYKKPVPMDLTAQTQEAPKAAQEVKTKQQAAPAQGQEGVSKEPKRTKNTANKVAQKKATTKNTANANPGAVSKKPAKDVSKSGLLGVFGTKGIQDQISKAAQGAGHVAGLSQNATGSAADGEGSAVGGSALRDTGANGNGTATVGIAGLNTKGRGGGASGYGSGTLGAKRNASLIAGDSEATFSPGIDKEAIRRVVLENLKQIKACYEKGLNRNPGLYGKIVIRWTIGPGGRVTSAGIKSTTMDSPDVENCSVARLRLWKFPEPPAGEEAEVSYPFVFQAQE